MEAVVAGQKPDIADLLTGLAVVAEAKRRLKGGRKHRKRYYMDSEQFGVGVLLARGEINREQALEMLCDLCACEKRTAEKHLADIMPRATVGAASFPIPD